MILDDTSNKDIGVIMKQIAIYGKGGIGKSTISANISYQLSSEGYKVAQIGCDPKHDSTRLLLGGKAQTTVLDHINSDSKDVGDTVSVGKNGILCIETGGPEPGVGCAGRGILTAFNFINDNDIIAKDTDFMIYDVLGDVVCGGFAVPLRRKYADAVFIVTSGEFMSLYAANNVLKGIRNFDGDKCRVAGLILNMRGNEGEYEYVKNFADAVGLPIVTRIPRSMRFSEAEGEGVTVSEKFPDSEEYRAVGKIVETIKGLEGRTSPLYAADPLNDDELDLVAKGKKVVRDKGAARKSRFLSVDERNVRRGCGSATACVCCGGIRDADIIVHGPKSCHFFFTSAFDGSITYEGKAKVLRNASQRVFCTDLTDHSSIFGGIKELERLIRARIEAGTKVIFVLTTCVPGIIGDDVSGLCERLESDNKGVRIVPIEVDGILNGSHYQAREITLRRMCSLIDRDVEPERDRVNIIGYHDSSDRTIMMVDDTKRIIEGLGLEINCCFLNDNDSSEFRMMRRGCIDLMFTQTITNRQTCQILEREAGIPWYRESMPIGMKETREWIREFGRTMNVPDDRIESLISSFEEDYRTFEEEYRGRFDGLRAVVYCPTATDIDWLFEILDTLGVTVTNIFSPTNSKWYNADEVFFSERKVEKEYDVNFDRLRERVDEIRPDMVIGTDQMLSRLTVPHFNFRQPRAGVRTAIEYGKRIVRMMEVSRA